MQLEQWTKRLLAKEKADLRGLRGWLLRLTRFLVLAGREFHRNLCFERAATLAFATVLSLIPLAVLFFSFAGLVGYGDTAIAVAKEKLFPLVAPDFQEKLGEWLDNYISKEAFENSLAQLVGLVALIGLFVAALGVMHTAERNFNRVWKVKSSRSYLQKFTAFWVILTISPFILVVSNWARGWLVPAGGVIEQLTKESLFFRGLYDFAVPVCLGFFAFTVLYVFLPSARVRLSSAALGAIVAAVLWELSKRGFFVYMGRTENLYGAIAIVPLFLVWLYLNWLIALWGCVLGYVRQNTASLIEAGRKGDRLREYPLAFVGILLLERVGRAFVCSDDPPTADAVAEELGVPIEDVREAAGLLIEGGVLSETSIPAEAYAIRRRPEEMQLRDIVELLPRDDVPEDLVDSDPDRAAAAVRRSETLRLFCRARDAYLDAFRGETLAGLVSPSAQRLEPPPRPTRPSSDPALQGRLDTPL